MEVSHRIFRSLQADKNKLGICLYTIDGNQFETGNTEDRFTIQSISKVMALCLALETFGAEFVFDHVGVERRERLLIHW